MDGQKGLVPQRRFGAWSDIPPELLERVVEVLGPRNRVAVRLVCASWRACVRQGFPSESPFDVPRLLFRRPGPGGDLAFFSLRSRKILPFALPARISAGRCCGHVAGWLAMALDSDRAVVLCNPVSGQSVGLPPPPFFPVSKVILSAPPTSPGWVAAVLGRTGMIALLQPSVSGAWRIMAGGLDHGSFKDMAFWRGHLCGLCHDGAILDFGGELGARAAPASLLRDPGQMQVGAAHGAAWQLYLVESDGELLLVRKLYNVWANAVQVEVHLLVSPEQLKWGVVETMPGRALVVGKVVSDMVLVELYEGAAALRESCVYFARREVEMLAPHAICEYSLLDGKTASVPIAGGHSADVEPVWITPFV
ncbi:hypothetical protein ACP4OV_001869 [Aristida adscensionis]